jgi:hypothetical protein
MTEPPPRELPAEEFHRIAVQIALRTGLLKKCPVHGDLYDPGQHDYQGAIMVASYLINQSNPLVAPFRGDRGPLAELLKSICSAMASSCAACTAATAVGSQPNGPSPH